MPTDKQFLIEKFIRTERKLLRAASQYDSLDRAIKEADKRMEVAEHKKHSHTARFLNVQIEVMTPIRDMFLLYIRRNSAEIEHYIEQLRLIPDFQQERDIPSWEGLPEQVLLAAYGDQGIELEGDLEDTQEE